MEKQKDIRLDQFLVVHNFVRSRTYGQDLIKKGWVKVDNVVVKKPNWLVNSGQKIEILQQSPYVSRAGEKIAEANKTFKVDFGAKTVLDIGASTGGFTDYALKNGASLVYALDVGTNQLDSSLVHDQRVVNMERTNLKEIPSLNFPKIDIILCDVSFIGLEHVFRAIGEISKKDEPKILLLIKPQFEQSGIKIKKFRGHVPTEFLKPILQKVLSMAQSSGYLLKQLVPLKIRGKKEKNQEFFGLFSRI